ncbi:MULTISPECIES: DUF6809 family protein [unclassified Ruminococcus]|uniref:DUF6809 family protein n=1 Tax=unclassified Ruminococcus TaxID=2608920 RepID=UPI00210E9284|nr:MULTISPECIES: DUF6809 family protein [unclassified Ruminococcus]MCQ4022406.1 hypothetical protein [Ruminococcus sp. zg-924]MCQ4114734.1 hypothetical protein [Ruminococcus sp. zg-921]
MRSLLEALYFGHFDLKVDGEDCQQEKKQIESRLDELEPKVEAMLGDEGKALFKEYADAYNELTSCENADGFIMGFRLGGRMVMEIIFGAEKLDIQH